MNRQQAEAVISAIKKHGSMIVIHSEVDEMGNIRNEPLLYYAPITNLEIGWTHPNMIPDMVYLKGEHVITHEILIYDERKDWFIIAKPI